MEAVVIAQKELALFNYSDFGVEILHSPHGSLRAFFAPRPTPPEPRRNDRGYHALSGLFGARRRR